MYESDISEIVVELIDGYLKISCVAGTVGLSVKIDIAGRTMPKNFIFNIEETYEIEPDLFRPTSGKIRATIQFDIWRKNLYVKIEFYNKTEDALYSGDEVYTVEENYFIRKVEA